MRASIGIVLLSLLLAPFVQAADETLYVRAQPSVALLSAPAADAVITHRLAPGDAVTVLGREAGFVNVQTGGDILGWMRETDLTAVVPAAQSVGQLENQAGELRRQLAAAQNALRTAQAELQQARQAAAAARSSGTNETAALTAERDALRQALDASSAELEPLRTRLAELEMAQDAAQLLAQRQPAGHRVMQNRFSPKELAITGIIAALLLLSGVWLGISTSRRRLRQRYHGLDL